MRFPPPFEFISGGSNSVCKSNFVINPGSTSTKIGVFDNERPVLEETIRHDEEQIGKYKRIIDQYEFRKETILEVLHSHGINISKLNAVCGRGDYFVQSKAEHTQ